MDTHVPANTNSNTNATELELFFQNLLRNISNILESKLSTIKTKLRNTFEKYSKGKVSSKHRKIVLELSQNENIVILMQDKGRGVVVMDNNIYYIIISNRFYGTAKLHKLPANGKIDDLPIRSIVLNINTATYQLSKHLSKGLSLLRESEHNIKITNDFIRQIKKDPIPAGHEMVSFDVKSLSTPLMFH